jgi:hypothetical protein
MNKNYFSMVVCCTFILTTHFLFAQNKGFVVGALGGAAKTNLYNKNDEKAEDIYIRYVRSYGSSFGIELGYNWASNWMLSLQPQWASVNQKYAGNGRAFGTNTILFERTINTQLAYYKLPIVVTKRFGQRRLKFMCSAGVSFWSLKTYKDQYKKVLNNGTTSGEFTYTDNSYSYNFGQLFTADCTLAEKIYKQNLIGAQLGLGFDYEISKKIQIFAQLKTEYTLFDMENKDSIAVTSIISGNPYYAGKKISAFRDSEVKYFEQTNSPVNVNAKHGDTKIFNLGFVVGARFIFFRNKY